MSVGPFLYDTDFVSRVPSIGFASDGRMKPIGALGRDCYRSRYSDPVAYLVSL